MFGGYFNGLAYDIAKWAVDIKNIDRLKSKRALKIADEKELKYRKKNCIPLKEIYISGCIGNNKFARPLRY